VEAAFDCTRLGLVPYLVDMLLSVPGVYRGSCHDCHSIFAIQRRVECGGGEAAKVSVVVSAAVAGRWREAQSR
jgi:hypothetical protein